MKKRVTAEEINENGLQWLKDNPNMSIPHSMTVGYWNCLIAKFNQWGFQIVRKKIKKKKVLTKPLTYVCDSCEDTEVWDDVIKYGFHCECGGHLHLVTIDNFKRVKKYTDCMICKNKNSADCIDCKRRPKNAD